MLRSVIIIGLATATGACVTQNGRISGADVASRPTAEIPVNTDRVGTNPYRTRAAQRLRSKLLGRMLVRAGVLVACRQQTFARRAIWNALITNRLPPTRGQWSIARLKSTLGQSIRLSLQLVDNGRLRCRSPVVTKIARDTNAVYVLLRRRFPRIPSAEAIASRSPTARQRSPVRRRLSDLFDVPSRGVQGF